MFDSNEGIAVYRGWHALEGALPSKLEVIDFDLVPDRGDQETFKDRQGVLRRIRSIRDQVVVADEQSEFIRAKLNASAFYIRCLEGETFEFYEHVQSMLAKTPELITHEEIEHQGSLARSLLATFGVPNTDGLVDPEAFQRFEASIRVYEADAEEEAHKAEERFIHAALELLGFSDLDVRHTIRLVREDAYWVGWSSGKPGSLLLRYNFHERHRWHKGDMEYLTLHEVCGHFVHAASLAREIAEKRLDPFVGITTVHDPHGFMGEGIADALTYFFPEELPLSPHAVLVREQRNWRDFLNNNAHIMINMGEREDQVLAEMLTNPFTEEESARFNLDRWRSHPLWRAYQYSYGIALKHHKRFDARMNHRQKIEYTRFALTRYVTPRRLLEFAAHLIG